MLTVAVAHVFRDADGSHLNHLHHVGLLAPDLRRPKSLNDPRLAEGWPAPLRLREVFEESNDTVLHFEVCIGLQQRSQIGGKRNRRADDGG